MYDHAALNKCLSDVYADDCCGHQQLPDLGAGDDDKLQQQLESMIRKVWKAKGMPAALDKWLTTFFADTLWLDTIKGFGKNLDDLDFDTPDYLMLRKLQEDVWHFSAAKNHNQLRALTDALTDADGQLRSYSQFKKAAFEINGTHVNAWLKAERNLAIASSQAAAKWVGIEKDKDVLPYLYFDAIIDGGTTEICRNFNGILLPFDHPFWDLYYIPNHYGERSDILQKSDGRITDIATIVYPEKIPRMFQTNLAKKQKVFPPDHPYYIGMPESMKEQAQKWLHGK